MADEPDDLTLRMLREIREKVNDFDVLKQRLDVIDQRLEEIHETLYTSAGIALHANARHEVVAKEIEALKQRLAKLEEKA